MAYYTAAGTLLEVASGAPATFDEVGFAALTYSAVGEVTSVPEHGAQYTLVTHNPLATRVTGKRKGSVNYGSMTLPMAYDDDDAGQIILADHADGTQIDEVVSVKLTTPKGNIRYFTALVMSETMAADSVDSILGQNVMLELDSSIVKVAAP